MHHADMLLAADICAPYELHYCLLACNAVHACIRVTVLLMRPNLALIYSTSPDCCRDCCSCLPSVDDGEAEAFAS